LKEISLEPTKESVDERKLAAVRLGRPVLYIDLTSFQEKSIYAKLPWVAEKEPLGSGRQCKSLQNEAKKTSRNRGIEYGNGDAIEFLSKIRSLAHENFSLKDSFYMSLMLRDLYFYIGTSKIV